MEKTKEEEQDDLYIVGRITFLMVAGKSVQAIEVLNDYADQQTTSQSKEQAERIEKLEAENIKLKLLMYNTG